MRKFIIKDALSSTDVGSNTTDNLNWMIALLWLGIIAYDIVPAHWASSSITVN